MLRPERQGALGRLHPGDEDGWIAVASRFDRMRDFASRHGLDAADDLPDGMAGAGPHVEAS